MRRLDVLVDQLAGPESEPGQETKQCDAAILRPVPGVGRIVLAMLLVEAHQAGRREITMHSNPDRSGASHKAERKIVPC